MDDYCSNAWAHAPTQAALLTNCPAPPSLDLSGIGIKPFCSLSDLGTTTVASGVECVFAASGGEGGAKGEGEGEGKGKARGPRLAGHLPRTGEVYFRFPRGYRGGAEFQWAK